MKKKYKKENKKDIDFVTFANGTYNKLIFRNIKNIEKIYPGSKIYFFDIGLDKKDKRKLKNFENVVLKKGKKFSEFNTNRFKEEILKYKIRVIKKGIELTEKKLVFLDADCLLLNKIDEVFDYKFDLGVTIRSREWGDMVNTGVIFIRKRKNTLDLLDKWVNEAEKINDDLQEQKGMDELYKKEQTIKAFPYETYNNFKIWKKINPKYNKILHYRGGLWKKDFKTKLKILYQKFKRI